MKTWLVITPSTVLIVRSKGCGKKLERFVQTCGYGKVQTAVRLETVAENPSIVQWEPLGGLRHD